MIEDYYIDDFKVKRQTLQNDGGGVFTPVFTDYSNVKGRLRPLTGNEILANDRIGLKTTHRFYCDVINVIVTDRIFDSVSSSSYDIKFIKNPMQMNHHLEIDCELIDA